MELTDAKQNWAELRSNIGRLFPGKAASDVVVEAGRYAATLSPPFGFVFNDEKLSAYQRAALDAEVDSLTTA
jgi:hypothetical protein